MPSLNLDFLNELRESYKEYSCFVETGTYNGDTIFALEPYFKELYTIEVSPKYYNQTKQKYKGNKINFMMGDSSLLFESLLPIITEKAIFFLDGHYSSGDTGRSEKDCPLYEEMTHIHNLFKNEAIIIVDDFRLFGSNIHEDWSGITKEGLLKIILPRIKSVYHLDSESAKDDRLIIHIRAKE